MTPSIPNSEVNTRLKSVLFGLVAIFVGILICAYVYGQVSTGDAQVSGAQPVQVPVSNLAARQQCLAAAQAHYDEIVGVNPYAAHDAAEGLVASTNVCNSAYPAN